MDDGDETDGPEDGSAPPDTPGAFRLPESPLGCGLGATLAFALLLAPMVLVSIAPVEQVWSDFGTPEFRPRIDAVSVVITAAMTILFGLVAAEIVRRRVAAAKAGGAKRPPPWTGPVAWLILGPAFLVLLALFIRNVLRALAWA